MCMPLASSTPPSLLSAGSCVGAGPCSRQTCLSPALWLSAEWGAHRRHLPISWSYPEVSAEECPSFSSVSRAGGWGPLPGRAESQRGGRAAGAVEDELCAEPPKWAWRVGVTAQIGDPPPLCWCQGTMPTPVASGRGGLPGSWTSASPPPLSPTFPRKCPPSGER